MADKGNCKKCRYFSLKDPNLEGSEVGICGQSELRSFELSVSGDSGCNRFEARIAAPETADAPALH